MKILSVIGWKLSGGTQWLRQAVNVLTWTSSFLQATRFTQSFTSKAFIGHFIGHLSNTFGPTCTEAIITNVSIDKTCIIQQSLHVDGI